MLYPDFTKQYALPKKPVENANEQALYGCMTAHLVDRTVEIC